MAKDERMIEKLHRDGTRTSLLQIAEQPTQRQPTQQQPQPSRRTSQRHAATLRAQAEVQREEERQSLVAAATEQASDPDLMQQARAEAGYEPPEEQPEGSGQPEEQTERAQHLRARQNQLSDNNADTNEE